MPPLVRRVVSAWPALVVPLLVGAVAALCLRGLDQRESRIRDEQLGVRELNERVLTQEFLIAEAAGSGRASAELRERIGVLRDDAHEQIRALVAYAPDEDVVRRLDAAWRRYVVSQSSRLDAVVAARPVAAQPLDAYLDRSSRVPFPDATSRDVAPVPTSFELLMGAVNGVETWLTERAAATALAGRLGTIATVALETLILAVTVLRFARTRARSEVAAARRRDAARFRALVRHASDVVTVVDDDLEIQYQTPSVTQLLGYEPDVLAGTRLPALIHPDDLAEAVRAVEALDRTTRRLDVRLRHHDGHWVHTETLVADLRHEPTVAGYVLTTRDVSERRTLEERLQHEATHDALTRLPDRGLFSRRLHEALERSRRGVAVLFIDLDDFKLINDSYGHQVGDHVLAAVGERLTRRLRPRDTAARLGGDEFAVLLRDVRDLADALGRAEPIVESLRAPVRTNELTLHVRFSVGLATAAGSQAFEEVLRDADAAMYAAKTRGLELEVYDPSMHAAVHRRRQLKSELEVALVERRFHVQHQPIVDLATGRIAGLEALARWRHPTEGVIPPRDFIPLAEETGLIVPLGRHVLDRACNDLRTLTGAGRGPGRTWVSVNVSGREVAQPAYVEQVLEVLDVIGLPTSALVLELTESVLLEAPAASTARLERLAGLGVRLAVDAFGSRHTSLAAIRELPISIMKLDRSLLRGLDTGPTRTLTAGVIDLARRLDLRVIAEGVETTEQATLLVDLGCDLGQGDAFGAASDLIGIARLLERQPALTPAPTPFTPRAVT